MFLLKKLQVFKKVKWLLWGHLGDSKTGGSRSEGKTLRKDLSHFAYIVFDFVLKRLLNCSREVWLLNLFGLHLSPQTS